MKKFSEKYVYENYNILQHSVIGFEFEFYTKLSYYKTLELINLHIQPKEVVGFKKYHPDFKPEPHQFMLTPDLSGGMNMIELITTPLPYFEARIYLSKILKFIDKHCYTTDKASIHINISFNQKSKIDLNDLNILKLILNTDEDYIYQEFPMRKGNIYCKSVIDLIPFKEHDFSKIQLTKIPSLLRTSSNDRYYGINFQHLVQNNYTNSTQRLEIRYIGGKDYEKKQDVIQDLMDLFIINIYNSIDKPIDNFDESVLDKIINTRKDMFRDITTYEDFLTEFPDINLQINQSSDYDYVSPLYSKINSDIKEIIMSAEKLENGIINFDTETDRLEVVNFESLNFTSPIKDTIFVNCTISKGIFNNCDFNNCELNNIDTTKSELYLCEIKKSKITLSKIDRSTEVCDSYITDSEVSGDIYRGVIRSGKITSEAHISKETMVIKEEDNFFGIQYNTTDQDNKLGKTKGKIKK